MGVGCIISVKNNWQGDARFAAIQMGLRDWLEIGSAARLSDRISFRQNGIQGFDILQFDHALALFDAGVG